MQLPAYGHTLVASASLITPTKNNNPQYDRKQDQLWDYYYTLEEYAAAVNWKANALSRIRLIAAEYVPGGDEPTPITEGPAAEAVARLAGGIGGQAQLMKMMGVHYNVPGEGWLVGALDEFGDETWSVYSADELRVQNGIYQLRVGESTRAWEPLGPDTVVVRFWRPNERYSYRATSVAVHALGAMNELDLLNKRIIAEITSRLASNGIMLYDRQRLSTTNGPNPAGPDQPDPFAQMLVDVGSRGIKDPMSAEATLKLPIGADLGDATDVKLSDLIEIIDMSNPVDAKLMEQRESAIRRVATAMDMPSDQLLGVSGMNHWGAAQIEESGIKLHIAPDAEMITHSLTKGYLLPVLRAGGEDLTGPNGGRIIIWYDPSEIVQRPDKSTNAIELYDRMELSGQAARREAGFSEADAPTEEEFTAMTRRLQTRAQAEVTVVEETVTSDTGTGSDTTQTDIGDQPPSADNGPAQVAPEQEAPA